MKPHSVKTNIARLPNGLELFYRETGRGDIPVLFVPGWTMSSAVFEKQLAYFHDSPHYRFISFDPRSHGNSSKTATGNNYLQHGRDLEQFITALGLEHIVLAGWSFGTLATLAWVHQFGAEKLAGFIMLDGPPRASAKDNSKEWATYQHDDNDGFRAFFTQGKLSESAAADREFVCWMMAGRDEVAVQYFCDITAQMPGKAAAELNELSVNLDFRCELVQLHDKMPLLYLVRAENERCVSEWSALHTPRASIHSFGSHTMFWEQSDRFNSVLAEYLRNCCTDLP